jgi:hypothetical protein
VLIAAQRPASSLQQRVRVDDSLCQQSVGTDPPPIFWTALMRQYASRKDEQEATNQASAVFV